MSGPEMRNGSRLVLNSASVGHWAMSQPRSGAASMTCSRLSSSSRSCWVMKRARQLLADRLSGRLTDVEPGGDRRENERRIIDWRKVNEDHAITVGLDHPVSDRDPNPGLADPARAGEGDDAARPASSAATSITSRSRPTNDEAGLGSWVRLTGRGSASDVRGVSASSGSCRWLSACLSFRQPDGGIVDDINPLGCFEPVRQFSRHRGRIEQERQVGFLDTSMPRPLLGGRCAR